MSSSKEDYNSGSPNEIQSIDNESPGNEGAFSAPLHRKLKSRHLQMIAIGGIIGPGLLVGSGNALHLAGPAGILISFILVGIIVFFVMYAFAPNCESD
jgi:amino acid transporter